MNSQTGCGRNYKTTENRSTRQPLAEIRENETDPWDPKQLATVEMGHDTSITLKIARSGVLGNTARTDRAFEVLKTHMTQSIWDRTALRVLSHRGMRWNKEWFIQQARKDDSGNPIPLLDLFVNTREIGDLQIFHILATLLNMDIPIIVTTRTMEKIEITFLVYSSMNYS